MKFPALITMFALFFVLVITNITNTVDSLKASEDMRLADIGQSMQEALETVALNVLEDNIDQDMKARGVSVLGEKYVGTFGNNFDTDRNCRDEECIKNRIRRQIRGQYPEYVDRFNTVIDVNGNGDMRNIFSYEILDDQPDDIGIGEATVYGDTGRERYFNQRVRDQETKHRLDSRQKYLLARANNPYYMATLRVSFYSMMPTENTKTDAANGQIFDNSGNTAARPVHIVEYPIRVEVRHVNTETDTYKNDLNR